VLAPAMIASRTRLLGVRARVRVGVRVRVRVSVRVRVIASRTRPPSGPPSAYSAHSAWADAPG
jgi:hypothetical protein